MIDRACDCRRLNSCPFCTVVSVTKAAELAGRPEATIRSWAKRGTLTPFGRVGQQPYFLEADVLAAERDNRAKDPAKRYKKLFDARRLDAGQGTCHSDA